MHGVQGLRVVDVSVMPSRHTNVPKIVLAGRASALISGET